MNRTYLTVGVIVLLLGFGTFWYSNYINKSADSIVQKLNDVEVFINEQKWDEAGKELSQISREWEKTKKAWSVLLHHQEIDNIDIGMKKVEKYIEGKSSVLGLGELSALRLLINHISDTESLSLQNIF
jgi:hypothetical protein